MEHVRRAGLVLIALALASAPSMGGPIPSKAADTRDADLAKLESFFARDQVAQALAAQGLSTEEVEQRLARLSAEDLSALAANVDQIQAAGAVPNYIWILLAILMGVTILATVF
ncbi:MAG: PA2779 family protein [Acidobacteriota bacterium]|nr:PA2779 family protein [Acidobacteriota bacterium]